MAELDNGLPPAVAEAGSISGVAVSSSEDTLEYAQKIGAITINTSFIQESYSRQHIGQVAIKIENTGINTMMLL